MDVTKNQQGSSISIHNVDSIEVNKTERFEGINNSFFKTLIIKSLDGSEVEINLFSKTDKSLSTKD